MHIIITYITTVETCVVLIYQRTTIKNHWHCGSLQGHSWSQLIANRILSPKVLWFLPCSSPHKGTQKKKKRENEKRPAQPLWIDSQTVFYCVGDDRGNDTIHVMVKFPRHQWFSIPFPEKEKVGTHLPNAPTLSTRSRWCPPLPIFSENKHKENLRHHDHVTC